jgi:3-dehydroquinate synthase/2-deoxy-scyllo-inosose synthase
MLRPTADYSAEELAWVISMCLDAKQSVMIDDPHEKSAALACEYGHTAGHVIELLCGYAHGLAIGVGGLVAARIAAALGILDASAEAMHEDLLLRSGAPVTVPGMPEEKLLAMLRGDNKRGYLPARRGHVDMVLLEEPGMLHYTGAKPITQVPEAIVLEAIRGRVLAA